MPPPDAGFAAGAAQTLREVLRTRDLVLTMVLAVVFYAFYYPLPYAHQSAQKIAVVMVDQDRSALSHALLAALDSTREVRVVASTSDFHQAETLVRERHADGILLLPPDLTRALAAGQAGAGLSLWVNGAYLTRAAGIGSAVQAVLLDAAREAASPLAASAHLRPPLELVVRPLFNPREGYASYVYPAVAILILQQTLMFGSAMLAATRREQRRLHATASHLAGTLSTLTLVGAAAAAFFFGWAFWLEDTPRTIQVGPLAVVVPLYALTVSALGLAIGSHMQSAARAMMWLAPTSVLLFFLTGAAWPLEQMPLPVALLARLSPATAGVHTLLPINQMGAGLREVAPQLGLMAGLCVAYLNWAAWRICRPAAAG